MKSTVKKNETNATEVTPAPNSGDHEKKLHHTFLVQFVGAQIDRIRNAHFRLSDVKRYAKVARKKCGLLKSAKQKGYGHLITDEEKRLVFCALLFCFFSFSHLFYLWYSENCRSNRNSTTAGLPLLIIYR